jgi:hypothetical protein
VEGNQQPSRKTLIAAVIGWLKAAMTATSHQSRIRSRSHRRWLEDYRRFGSDPKPEGPEPSPMPFEQWLKDNPPPDLQALVERAGDRRGR